MEKEANDPQPEPPTEHHENLIERVAENLESRFLAEPPNDEHPKSVTPPA